MTESDDWAALVTAAQPATTSGKMRWIADDPASSLRWQQGQASAVTLTKDGTTYTLAIIEPTAHHIFGSTTSADTTGLDALWSTASTAASGWPVALTHTLAAVQALAP